MKARVAVAVALAAGLAGGYFLRGTPAPASPDLAAAPEQLWTCGMHPQVLRHEPGSCPICGMALTPLRHEAATPGTREAVTIDPVVVQNMGVRVAPVRRGALAASVRAAGVLAEAQPAQHDVTPRVGGVVTRLWADTDGMHVQQGAPLFALQSPELDAAVGELIAARRAAEESPTAASSTAAAVRTAVERKLARWGVAPDDVARLARLDAPPPAVTFRSPIDGHVVMKEVVEGDGVEAGRTVLRIVDHRALWLEARVFERQLGAVRLGQPATATLDADPGRPITGTVSFVHPHLDAATRTGMVRVAVPNPDLALRPGMFATVELHGEVAADAVLVPREAVIDTGTRQLAFVARPGGRFEARTLRLGEAGVGPDGPAFAVLDGLAPGDDVVVSGQFLLDAESRLREGIARFQATEAGR
ncbi:MAG: efflux RND transporter periplasmic adaptor subunit [bacterium]|nr:efflux RND transporter periplasmic adaptor subunit [bacterium]